MTNKNPKWTTARVSQSCSTSGTRLVTSVTNLVKIIKEENEYGTVTIASGTYLWSFVTQIFSNGNQEIMASQTHMKSWLQLTTRNPWFSNFCVITIPLSRNSKEYFINGDIYSICRSCWNVATYKWKVHNGKIEIISIVVKSRS